MDATYENQLKKLQEAAQGGDLVAAYNLGVISEDEGCIGEARKWYRQADHRKSADGTADIMGKLRKKSNEGRKNFK